VRIAVLAYFVILGLTEGLWVARIPGLTTRLHLTDGLLGLSLLAGPGALILAMPLAGRLADRFGSARLTRHAGLAVAVLPVILWTAGSLAAVIGALLAFGIAGGMLDVAINAQGVRVEQAYRRPLMASFHASYSLGGLAGAVLGGVLVWRRGASLDTLGGIALGSAAAAALAGRWLAHEPGPAAAQARSRATAATAPAAARTARPAAARRLRRAGWRLSRPAARALWPARAGAGSHRLLALGLLALCCLIAEGAAGNWSGIYLHQVLREPRVFAVSGFAGFSLAMAAGRLSGDRLAARYGSVRLVRGCGLLAAAGLVGALCIHRADFAVAGFAACGGGLSCTVPQLFSAAGHADPAHPGGGIARVAGLGYVGLVGGPVLIGGFATLAGLPAALCIPVALGVCVAVFAFVLEPPLAAAPAPVSETGPGRSAGSRSR
jgi:MFS family permease